MRDVLGGAKRSMEKGVVFGNIVLGYYLENGKITGINPEEAEIVKSIFHKYLYEEKRILYNSVEN